MYVTNYWWAALFLIQAAVTALIIHQTSFATAYNYDQILPVVAIGPGILGSIALGRYFARKGRRRSDTASARPARLALAGRLTKAEGHRDRARPDQQRDGVRHDQGQVARGDTVADP